MTVTLPEKKDLRIALLGAGHHLCAFAHELVRRGFPRPIVVTHPKSDHERDRLLLTDPQLYAYVFDVANELELTLIEAQTVNNEEVLARLAQQGCNVAFSLSCRSIIKQPFIDAFSGKVFNVHPSMLPNERGGGTFSWRIMNASPEVSATLHLIDGGIDTGDVIFQEKRNLTDARPVPADYMRVTNEIYMSLLGKFLDQAEAAMPLPSIPQDEHKATYLPRLHTETNGAIDWSWCRHEIDRFIRAFADPYPGAYTFIGDKRVCILDSEPHAEDRAHHPFMAGRVDAHNDDGSVRVMTVDGYLSVRNVLVDGVPHLSSKVLSVTDMFSTPPDILQTARTGVVSVKRMGIAASGASQ